MLTSNSAGASTLVTMEALRNAACNRYFLRRKYLDRRWTESGWISVRLSSGVSPSVVLNSIIIRPRYATPSPFPMFKASNSSGRSENSRGDPYRLMKHGPKVGRKPEKKDHNSACIKNTSKATLWNVWSNFYFVESFSKGRNETRLLKTSYLAKELRQHLINVRWRRQQKGSSNILKDAHKQNYNSKEIIQGRCCLHIRK